MRHFLLLSILGTVSGMVAAGGADDKSEKLVLPKFCMAAQYSSRDLIDAANVFIAMKADRAVQELRKSFAMSDNYSDHNLRLSLLCRVLFVPKGKEPLRGARLGSSGLPRETMPSSDWPNFPVVQAGKSFFVLSEVLEGTGIPEQLTDYLEYCLEEGVFRTELLPIPSKVESRGDLVRRPS